MVGPPPPPITGAKCDGENPEQQAQYRQRRFAPQIPPLFIANPRGMNLTSFAALTPSQAAQNVFEGTRDAQNARIHGLVLREQLRRDAAAADPNAPQRPDVEDTPRARRQRQG